MLLSKLIMFHHGPSWLPKATSPVATRATRRTGQVQVEIPQSAVAGAAGSLLGTRRGDGWPLMVDNQESQWWVDDG